MILENSGDKGEFVSAVFCDFTLLQTSVRYDNI